VSKGDGRSRADATGRLGVTAVVAALVAVTAIVAAVLTVGPGTSRAASDPPAPVTAASAAALPATSAAASVTTSAFPGAGAGLAAAAAAATAAQPADAETMAVSLTLTAADHQDCPAKATACVDLTRHITWLQRGGKVSYGPVQMEPGHPAGAHQTPRGTFHVSWKAGPAFRSSEYNEAMPWATFFAAGGIAFHGGPLDVWSHGCVHLTDHNAHYFQQHLPVGAEVVVF
jgi:lipoprotein-anchoring transpeptidase ErfK/SrfK